MKKRSLYLDVYFGVVALIFLFILHSTLGKMPVMSQSFPRLFLVVTEILTILILISGIRKTIKGVDNSEFKLEFKSMKFTLLFFCLVAVYGLGIFKVGYFVSTLAFTAVAMIVMNYRKRIPIILNTICLSGFIYLIFVEMLKVRMPSALLF